MSGSGIISAMTSIEIPIEDEFGMRNGKTALVWISYVQEIDLSYGEDADGRRGVPKVEYSILDKWIEPSDFLHLTSAEVEYALMAAEQRFYRADKHW